LRGLSPLRKEKNGAIFHSFCSKRQEIKISLSSFNFCSDLFLFFTYQHEKTPAGWRCPPAQSSKCWNAGFRFNSSLWFTKQSLYSFVHTAPEAKPKQLLWNKTFSFTCQEEVAKWQVFFRVDSI
jgi:hypothetical protein